MAMTTFAAIDIGSYEISMKIFEFSKKIGFQELNDVRYRLEIGKGAYSSGRLEPETVDTICVILKDFSGMMKEFGVTDYRACATSAFREIINPVIVQEQIGAKLVAAGTDLSFGDRGLGDCKLLKARAEAYGYEVKIIDKVLEDGEEISSTRVRQAVEAGKMQEAARLLGAPYAVMGTVVHGRQLGRTLGFPTVNLMPPADKLLPPNGVYRSEVECSSGVFKGLTNVGVKPTVEHGDHPPMSVETYIYDFSEDIYDSFITVRLLTFERPEQKFADVEELKEQLQRDIAAGAR